MNLRRGAHIQIFTIMLIWNTTIGFAAESRIICAARYKELFDTYTPLSSQEFQPKIGIELEGTAPLDIGLRGFAEIIRLSLLKQYPLTTIQYNRPKDSFARNEEQFYVKYKKRDGRTLIWTVKEDHSIRTNELPLEITSPILQTPQDFEDFKKVVQSIQQSGARSQPESAGVHVHVDFSRAQGSDMAALAGIFSEIEKELKDRFSTLPTRELNIENTSRALLKTIKIEDLNSKKRSLIYDLLDTQDRLHALNLQSYYKLKTVEFRLFNSTFNIEALELMSDFTLKLVKEIRTQNPKLVAYLTESNEPIHLDELSKILGTSLHLPQANVILEKIFRESQQVTKKTQLNQSPPQERMIQRLAILLTSVAWVHQMVNQAESLGDHSSQIY